MQVAMVKVGMQQPLIVVQTVFQLCECKVRAGNSVGSLAEIPPVIRSIVMANVMLRVGSAHGGYCGSPYHFSSGLPLLRHICEQPCRSKEIMRRL